MTRREEEAAEAQGRVQMNFSAHRKRVARCERKVLIRTVVARIPALQRAVETAPKMSNKE